MKRTIFLKVFTTFLIVIYSLLIIFSLSYDTINFYKFWFSFLLLILGISIFARYICFHIDSNLFSGSLLIFLGTWGVLNYYFNFDNFIITAGYILSFALSFVAVFIKFRQIFHLKAFAFLFLYVIVLVIYSSNLMPLWLFISLLGIISIMIVILTILNIKSNMGKV